VRIFICELRKLWNWRVLLVIAAFGVITWFAFFTDILNDYESLKTHGMYSAYQTEMFKKYGETLEPEEWEDFDIKQQYAVVYAAGDDIIAEEPIFAKYGVESFSGFLEWYESGNYWVEVDGFIVLSGGELTPENQDRMDMLDALNCVSDGYTLDEWYNSPMVLLQSLRALEDRYTNQQLYLDIYTMNDTRPAVVRAAERLKASDNNSLLNGYLLGSFSLHAAVTGVFALISVMVLIIPMLIIDRSRNIHLLQYSSAVGRKLFRTQFFTTLISTIALSGLLTVLLFAPFIARSAEYWNAGVMSLGGDGMWMYDISYGQYVLILGGMIVAACTGAACLAFILARFSANIVTVMIKSVPVAAALATVLVLSTYRAFSNNNIVFNQVFAGESDMPEVIVCGLLCLSGLFAAAVVMQREKRVDV